MREEKFEVVEVLGQTALFTNGRIAPGDVPEGLYASDLRHSDDGDRFATLEPKVVVNHGGTILTHEPVDFGEKGYIPLTEDSAPNFLGEEITVDEFLSLERGGMQISGMEL